LHTSTDQSIGGPVLSVILLLRWIIVVALAAVARNDNHDVAHAHRLGVRELIDIVVRLPVPWTKIWLIWRVGRQSVTNCGGWTGSGNDLGDCREMQRIRLRRILLWYPSCLWLSHPEIEILDSGTVSKMMAVVAIVMMMMVVVVEEDMVNRQR
jgi:hypothetical protein